jgi:predicted DCC family thiol-disulfide oxidoreductase YuxK
VQFVIRHDKKKLFLFAALQSEPGKQAIAKLGENGAKIPDSFILKYKNNYYTRSAAALMVCRLMGGAWRMLYGFTVIPRFLRDSIYDFVSRNRYKWFGKQNACMIPTPDLMDRFLSK